MRTIFISYRREDTEGQAGRLFADLVKIFGERCVFMDVATIQAGRDFRKAIDEQISSCGVLLALIGKNWIDARDEAGNRRLDDPLDLVRLEIGAALKLDINVVPVLVQGVSMPRAEQLPADLADLAFRNAIELTHARWNSDLTVLGKDLAHYISTSRPHTADWSRWARVFAAHSPRRRRYVVAIVIATILILAASVVRFLQFPGGRPDWHFAAFPSPPNQGAVAFTILSDGNPACASYDQLNCLWGVPVSDLNFSKLEPLACGEMHRAKWGRTGYEDPKHWCSVARISATAR